MSNVVLMILSFVFVEIAMDTARRLNVKPNPNSPLNGRGAEVRYRKYARIVGMVNEIVKIKIYMYILNLIVN